MNRTAPVVVMTTEVLRNMLLTESDQLTSLGLVVLDEVHYLQDPFRGGVWEEVLILTPASGAIRRPLGHDWQRGLSGRVAQRSARTDHRHRRAQPPDRAAQPHRRHETRATGAPRFTIYLMAQRLSSDARRIDNLMKSTRKFRPGPKWQGPKSSAPPPPFRAPRRSELMHALETRRPPSRHRLHLLAGRL